MTLKDILGTENDMRPVILAPMAGITDFAFRSICFEYGADFAYTEMISSKGLIYKSKKTFELIRLHEGRKIGIQLFGNEPHEIAESIRMILDRLGDDGIALFDINMGCPAPKIVKNGAGSALMDEPYKAGLMIAAAKKATDLPVTAKIRKGLSSVNYLEFAKRLCDNGLDMITLHGRTREEYYSGEADWDSIRLLKDNINIPVIANGNIVSRKSMEECLDYTKADGVMIARASLGYPGVFSELKTGTGIPVTKEMILEHYQLSEDEKGEYTALKEMRKHLLWYLKGRKYAASLKNEAVAIENRGSFMGFVEKVFGEDL